VTQSSRFKIKGIAVSPGIIAGTAYVIRRNDVAVPQRRVAEAEVDQEVERFRKAVELSREQLEEVRRKLGNEQGDHVLIVDTYRLLLQDEMLTKGTETIIHRELINAEWALQQKIEEIRALFNKIEDAYIRERKSDVDFVAERIFRNFWPDEEEPLLSGLPPNAVLIAHDLSPADTSMLPKFHVAGFVTEIGGRTSHTAILARSLGLPALVGAEGLLAHVNTGDPVIIDGLTGTLIIHPHEDEFKLYIERRERYEFSERQLAAYRNLPAETRDGYRIRLLTNIELPEEIPQALEMGAEGVGLYRTEFLYLNRLDLPSEEEHFDNYRRVLERMHPLPATIRTCDIGGDKIALSVPIERGANPAMGLRAVRLYNRYPEIFRTQVRGMLRASIYGKLKILLPLITSVTELVDLRRWIDEEKEKLRAQGIPFDPHVPIGVMIETPAACMMADVLAREADFFSVGTNDLIQYALAVDRQDEHVAYLYEPLHPAILRMVKRVNDIAHEVGIPVSICGEMGGEEIYLLVLLGLRFDELSMNARSIPRMKRLTRKIEFSRAEWMVQSILALRTARDIDRFVRREMVKLFPEDFPEEIYLRNG
jgi:phosphoenolpyruvate-protein phosphotransferase (PTS system enzyme I)